MAGTQERGGKQNPHNPTRQNHRAFLDLYRLTHPYNPSKPAEAMLKSSTRARSEAPEPRDRTIEIELVQKLKYRTI